MKENSLFVEKYRSKVLDEYVGNIFYEQGIGVLTNYPISIIDSSSIKNIQFQNSYTLYEQNMVCRVKDYEFNASYNPTLTTGSFGFIYESASVVGVVTCNDLLEPFFINSSRSMSMFGFIGTTLLLDKYGYNQFW